MRINKDCWLLNKPIAHRGLWGGEIVENSIAAYENAAKKSYPIEIDLYSSTDGVLYCFHDKTLNRMTGKDGFIFDKTSGELSELSLIDGGGKIPKFSEVLEIANGRSPLLIEIKDQPRKDIIKLVVEALKDYTGEFAIQSFNPFYINRVKKLAPNFIRGILGSENVKGEKLFTRLAVKRLIFNFLIKPDFISYNQTGLPLKKCKTKKTPVISWTITNDEQYERVKPFAKNIIFENFIPR